MLLGLPAATLPCQCNATMAGMDRGERVCLVRGCGEKGGPCLEVTGGSQAGASCQAGLQQGQAVIGSRGGQGDCMS